MWQYLLYFLALTSLSDGLHVQRIASIYNDEKSFFNSNSKVLKQGQNCRNIQYTATAVGQRILINSPNYPNNYPPSLNCSYFISSPQNTKLRFQCNIHIACPRPNDHIYWSLSGNRTFSDSKAFCGRGTINNQTSIANNLAIGFRSHVGQRPPLTSGQRWRYQCEVRVVRGNGPVASTTVAPPISTTIIPESCSCGIRNVNGASKIVGGSVAKAGEIPWRVTVFIYAPETGSGSLCGGTIISPNWVMTAAHCTMSYKPGYKIIVYTEAQANPVTQNGGIENEVDRFVQHPMFNTHDLDNDIALLHLSTPLTFKSNLSAACLPFGTLSKSDHAGTKVLASGWGTTEPVPIGEENHHDVSDQLREVELPVLTTAQCRQYQSLTDNQFCTYNPGKDTCQGDSGGSIDFKYTNERYYAIGITSFGYGCAQKGYPGAYTKVNNYLSWIQTNTGDTFCQTA